MVINAGDPIKSQNINDVYDFLLESLPYRGCMGDEEYSSSKDFNDYTLNGIYCNVGTNYGYSNTPHPADNGYLIVIGGGYHQFWFSEFQLLPVMYRYMTNKTNKTWSAWVSLV